MVHVAVLILLAASCALVVGALLAGIFFWMAIMYYTGKLTRNGFTGNHEPLMLFAFLIVLLLLFVGSALYNWADTQVMLSETPVSVVVFIVYIVVAIEATLCMVPVVMFRMEN